MSHTKKNDSSQNCQLTLSVSPLTLAININIQDTPVK